MLATAEGFLAPDTGVNEEGGSKPADKAAGAAEETSEEQNLMHGTLGILEFHLGTNFIEAEETSEGEGHLKKAKLWLAKLKLHPRYCST